MNNSLDLLRGWKSYLLLITFFAIAGFVLFIPEYFFLKANDISYPGHKILAGKLIKFISVSFFVPLIFSLAGMVLLKTGRQLWRAIYIIVILVVAVFLHLILNEFLQSLVGFRPKDKSIFELVRYTFGRGLDTQFLTFVLPLALFYILYGRKKKPDDSDKNQLISRIEVRRKDQNIWVDLRDIQFVEAYGNYLRLHHGENNIDLVRTTLRHIMTSLPENFVRTHRSYLVNLDFAKGMRKSKTGSKTVILEDHCVPVSRYYYRTVRDSISKKKLE